jgi:(E)-4-hydroxy-3-methylbut-2-enyl-diphosphate synthase
MISVGPLQLGGTAPILLQSMLNVPLSEMDSCLAQVESLRTAGCFLIRVALPTITSLRQFESLRHAVEGEHVAFVADLHFGSQLALDALDIFEKVRINPGNFAIHRTPAPDGYDEKLFAREEEMVREEADKFFRKAKKLRRVVRIGCNGGSVSARMRWRWGDETAALLRSAEDMHRWATDCDFSDLVFSFKASDPLQTISLNVIASKKMACDGQHPPFHIGVTEAGVGSVGRVKGALGIGVLLSQGIGDTIRVSLTEPPEKEISFAKKLLRFVGEHPLQAPKTCPATLRVVEHVNSDASTLKILPFPEPFDGDAAALAILQQILVTPSAATICVVPGANYEERREIVEDAVQACGFGKMRTEVIACPTCGRTTCDVAALAKEVRRRLGNFPQLKIAVMGCVVNGVGEMGNADYGCIGCGGGNVNVYRRGVCLLRGVASAGAVDELERLINADIGMESKP